MTVLDTRIARQARVLAKADAEMRAAQQQLREARAKRDAALTRLNHLTEDAK